MLDDGGFAIAGETGKYRDITNLWQNGDIWLVRTNSEGDTLWTKTYVHDGMDEAFSIQQTSDGGFIIGGALASPLGWYNAGLIRTDMNGDTLWTKSYKISNQSWVQSVEETPDGGFIFTGSLSNDIWLVRTDADGVIIWEKTFGTSGTDLGKKVKQTSDGGFIVTGYVRPPGAGRDLKLIRTDAAGDTLWTRVYNGDTINSEDRGLDIHVMDDDSFVVLGQAGLTGWLLRADEQGDTLWAHTYNVGLPLETLIQTSDGGFVFGGAHLTRTDGSGNVIWSVSLGGFIYSIHQVSDNGFVVTGYSFSEDSRHVLWIHRLGTDNTTFLDDDVMTPSGYGLFQNYPNPFNPATTITYELSEPEFVRLSVYDVTGRKVNTLVERMQSAGRHTIVLDATGFSSGTYIYRIEAGSFISTGKMVLLK
ncbi:MAG: T9SS type A sorting domain-containing protein [Rhodothermaceae bacterium]|nr:T9SS type A sorting domain-containing protein [Rhodothermaceae bacterium]